MHQALLMLAILSLSQSPNMVRWSQAPVEVIGAWRMLLASLIMGALCLYAKSSLKKLSKQQFFWVLSAGIFLFVHLWTYFFAAKNTLIANTVVIFSTNPVWTALGGILIFKQRMQPRTLAALGLALLAIVILFWERLNLEQGWGGGEVSALLSAMLFTGYMLSSLKSRELGVENKVFTFWIYGICGFAFLLTAVVRHIELWDYPARSWIGIAGLILFPTLLGHAIFTHLLKHINIHLLSTSKLAEPILSAVVAWMLFSEPLHPATAYAFLLIAASLMILFEPWKYLRSKNTPAEENDAEFIS